MFAYKNISRELEISSVLSIIVISQILWIIEHAWFSGFFIRLQSNGKIYGLEKDYWTHWRYVLTFAKWNLWKSGQEKWIWRLKIWKFQSQVVIHNTILLVRKSSPKVNFKSKWWSKNFAHKIPQFSTNSRKNKKKNFTIFNCLVRFNFRIEQTQAKNANHHDKCSTFNGFEYYSDKNIYKNYLYC